MACFSPLKGYKDPYNGALVFKRTANTKETMEVRCGQCLGCRIDRRIVWAVRVIHESTLHERNCFVTLTYRDKHHSTDEQYNEGYYLPDDLSLYKSHFQKFMRRLRKQFPQKIKYFYCGEYGSITKRPHYHACLFNVDFDDCEVFSERDGLITYYSRTLERLWRYGFCTVGELNYDTASYTAGYILEKITGFLAEDHYLRSDADGVASWVLPEYVNMSLGRKKPGGIGAGYYEKYKNDIFPRDTVWVPGKGVVQQVPRYYQTILESEDPATLELVQKLRKQFMAQHREDFTPERLMDRYKVQKAKKQNQKRDQL